MPTTTPSYVEHFIELRSRLLKFIGVYTVLLVPAIYYEQLLFTHFSQGLNRLLPQNHLIATQITAPLMVPLKLAFFITLLISMPYLLYQIWAFIAPGLYAQEQRPLKQLLWLSIGLFYTGIGFAYLIVAPCALHFFYLLCPENVTLMTDMSAYLNFINHLLLSFGLAFEIPIVLLVLLRLKLVTVASLKAKRGYFIVIAFIIGMLLTPPDVFSQILLALPLIGLFEASLLLAQYSAKSHAITHKPKFPQ
jgi:sec-independent protein translocase protein TatC